jgi:hypothetical protein
MLDPSNERLEHVVAQLHGAKLTGVDAADERSPSSRSSRLAAEVLGQVIEILSGDATRARSLGRGEFLSAAAPAMLPRTASDAPIRSLQRNRCSVRRLGVAAR